MLFPGGLHDDVQQSGRELAEHFYGAPRDAATMGSARGRNTLTREEALPRASVFMPLATPAAVAAFALVPAARRRNLHETYPFYRS